MSKQPLRQLSRQEQRRLAQQQREEEQRRAGRAKRIIRIGILVVSALMVAGLIALIVLQKQTPANVAYRPIDTVSCDSGEHSDFHIHAQMTLYIKGKPVPLPASIGIASDQSCLYWLHTHSTD